MMEQYRSIKGTLSEDTILFFRLGDFYEMFFDDAVRASDILNITLTGREAGQAGRVPMCGIPYHAFHSYVRTLIDHNLKVAICEQVGDPKASKGLVERKVTRIISPATYLDDEAKGNSFEYMAAIARDGKQVSVAYLELSTGEFCVREVLPERLLSELTLLDPREVILPHSLAADNELKSFVKNSIHATLTVYEDWVFAAEEGLRLLTEAFSLASQESLDFHDHPLAVSACGSILYYLRDHFHSALGHVQIPSLLGSDDFMMLDRQTQRSLELVADQNGEKHAPTLFATINQTMTSMGRRTLHRWVTHPLLSIEEIERRQESVAELMSEAGFLESLRTLMKGVRDMERTLSRLNYGLANARDLVNLRIFLERVPEWQSLLSPRRSAGLQQVLTALHPFPNLRHLIERAIVDEPPLSIKDSGVIKDGYDEGLDELRKISQEGKSWLLEFERRESERTGIKKLKIKYSQVFGYMIEVSKSNLQLVPEDYVRRQTLANAERFVTPELKEWDQKISGAQDKIKTLEYQLFDGVRKQILENLNELQAMAQAIGILDALCSLAETARQKNWVRPQMTTSSDLRIEGGRHPVVEAMLPSGEFVENDTTLNGATEQLALLTGPNMAGKSTFIRQVALLVVLAQLGSFIPARSAEIGLVDRIFTRIGASDDLARGESTFMVEMVEMAHILRRATDRSLLILDEVGRGTSTFDGVSIAWAICEHLAKGKIRPRTLFATHYHELTQLEGELEGLTNYTMSVRESGEGIIFLRKVVPGATDRSYGIHVAKLAGIPQAVINRANQILSVLERESGVATRLIEGKPKGDAAAAQTTLFGAPVEESPLLDEIRQTDVSELTPLDALNRIAAWKESLS